MDWLLAKVQVFGVAFWQTARQMSFWLLWGFLLAGVLSLVFTPGRVERHLGRRAGWRAVLWAVGLGVPLPLCSCGVLPVAAGLRRGGASKGATAGFLLATPQTGLDSILATYALLGWPFAVMRPLVALVSGLTGGWLIEALAGDAGEVRAPEGGVRESAGPGPARGAAGLVGRVVCYAFDLLGNVARPLGLGLVFSALILAFVPPGAFSGAWLGNDWVAFPVMLLVGMPLYVCSTASIPMALALMVKGLSPGAALVFLIVGPALNGASLTMLVSLLGRRAVVLFLGVLSAFAVGAGVLLNGWVGAGVPGGGVACCAGAAHGSTWAAVVLLALLGYHLAVKPFLRRCFVEPVSDVAQMVKVKGMMCDHCRGQVERLLCGYAGVTAVRRVSPDTFAVEGVLPETLAQDLAALGFEWVV